MSQTNIITELIGFQDKNIKLFDKLTYVCNKSVKFCMNGNYLGCFSILFLRHLYKFKYYSSESSSFFSKVSIHPGIIFLT